MFETEDMNKFSAARTKVKSCKLVINTGYWVVISQNQH